MTIFKTEIENLYHENSKTSAVTAKFARALNIVINTSLSVPMSRNNVFSSAASFSNSRESASTRVKPTENGEGAGAKPAKKANRETMSAEEKAKRFQFLSGFKLGPDGVIFESNFMSFEDITDKVKLFVLQEVNQYSRKGKAHEWGRGAVFQHLLRHYMAKFSSDIKAAEMQSPTQIRFISKDHRIVIDVQLFKHDSKASKKDFDGDIHVTKRTFNEDGALISEKVNKINVISGHAPKEGVAANINLHWYKDKKEACRLDNGMSNKQLQISDVRVSI